jgi:hypothetical protein
MKPGPAHAAILFHLAVAVDAPPRETMDWLEDLVEEHGWKGTSVTAREKAEKWHTAFHTRLQSDLSELNRLGRYCSFTFNSSAGSQVQGAAFIEPSDSAVVVSEKERRKRYKDYVSALRLLIPRDLEKLCAGLLSLLGIESPKVTKYSADRGVDFYGTLRYDQQFGTNSFFPHWHKQLKTWMIGQAKHYVDGTVSTPALRDLVGTVTLLKGPLADRRAYPSLVLRSCDPVFLLLVTTGRFSREVWDEIDRSGAIGIDGEMLASFFASRAVGCHDDVFNAAAFSEWIDSFDAAFIEVAEASDEEE